jgi:hypothetical protein
MRGCEARIDEEGEDATRGCEEGARIDGEARQLSDTRKITPQNTLIIEQRKTASDRYNVLGDEDRSS